MSRTLFAFLLSELKTVRLICRRPQCKGVTEIAIEQLLGERFCGNFTPACPVCTCTFTGTGSGDKNQLVALANAIINLRGVADALEVEFVIPEEKPADEPKK